MNIQQLKYFTTVSEKGSFVKAAESLYISQQGLNMAISNLESEFSCRLFKRVSGKATLTEDGRFFLAHAKKILAEVDAISEHFGTDHMHSASIQVAGCQGTLSEFAANTLLEYKKLYPNIHVHLRELKDKEVDVEVLEERCELGFGLEPMDTKTFECHRIFSCPLMLLVHKSNPLAEYEKIPIAALAGQTLIAVGDSFKIGAEFLINECAKQGVKVESVFRVGEVIAVHRLVSQNIGVGLTVLTEAKGLNTPDTVCRPFESDKFLWCVDIFKKKNYTLSKPAQSFFNFACRSLANK